MGLIIKKYWKEILAVVVLVGLFVWYSRMLWVTADEAATNRTKLAYEEAQKLSKEEYERLQRQYQSTADQARRDQAERFRAIDEAYQRGLNDGRKSPQATIDELARDNKRLSVELKRSKATRHCDTGSPTSPGVDNGTERAELSDKASGFFIGEADRADVVVKQLTACQVIANDYYRTISELQQQLEAAYSDILKINQKK